MLHSSDTELTSNAVLAAHGLTCIRGDRVLFRNVGFTLNTGGLLYVLGENGSGKSSLLRLICGLLSPEAGDVAWRGQDVRDTAELYRSELLYIGHLGGLKDDLTAFENLQTNAELAGYSKDAASVSSALQAIGVGRCANLPVRVLSQGQKRRVALAKLWLSACKLWVLDEPFAALDSASIDILSQRISQHLQQDGLAIITTHQDVSIEADITQTLRLNA